MTCRDEVRLDSGFVSRAVVDALLEPLAEFNCDKTGREFLIKLFQARSVKHHARPSKKKWSHGDFLQCGM